MHLGLEDDQDVGQVEGARQDLHLRPLAPARDVQTRLCRLGRGNQILGLIKQNKKSIQSRY